MWSDGAATGGKPGKGQIVAGKTPAEILSAMKVPPDFVATRPLRHIHRALADKDLYFVANSAPQAMDAVCTFRVTGKTPQAWFPDTGRIEPISVFEEADGCTRIPLRFEPSGSLFVVFQPGPAKASQRIVSVQRDGRGLIQMGAAGATVENSDVINTFTMAAWVKPSVEIVLPQETADGIAANGVDRNDVLYPPPGHEVWTAKDTGAGFGVGKNGVCVCEHGDTYFPALLVHAAPITDWTHVAVVYRDGTPSLYLNGKLVRTGLKGKKIVHSGVGVSHGRELKEFRGQVAGLRQFREALSDEQVAKLALTKPAGPDLPSGPALDYVSRRISQQGNYEIKTADGHSRRFVVSALPEPFALAGPWEVKFAPGRGAPAQVVLDHLVSWSESADTGIKYFSGSAVYRKSFAFSGTTFADPSLKPVVELDLGKVAVMAEVKLNGKELGMLWKPPYRVDITEAVKNGENLLEVRVVNLPVNRMIGDELLPEDSERNGNGTLKSWPQWLLDGKPSPTGRATFTSWRLWKKDAPLQESGLLGPVTVSTSGRIDLTQAR